MKPIILVAETGSDINPEPSEAIISSFFLAVGLNVTWSAP